MLKRILKTIVPLLILLLIAVSVQAASTNESIFGERNVAIITAADKNFTQQDLSGVMPYIRANITFPTYSIQTNELFPYGSIIIKNNEDLSKLAQKYNADILLFINMPQYEEYYSFWFNREVLHVNVFADIYLHDTQTQKTYLYKLRNRDSGEYGSVATAQEVLIKALNDALEKLPGLSK